MLKQPTDRMVAVNVSLSLAHIEALDELARQLNASRSQALRGIIDEYRLADADHVPIEVD